MRVLPLLILGNSVGWLAIPQLELCTSSVMLSNERKVFGGVLALALVALAVDRVFVATDGASPLGPATAAGETVTPADLGEASSTPVIAAAKKASGRAVHAVPVAKQFELINPYASNEADGFAPPQKWQTAIEREMLRSQIKPKPVVIETNALVDEWRKTKRFTAVAKFSDGTQAVVINGQSVRVGEQLGGYTLTAISTGKQATSAKFADPSGEVDVVLELPSIDNQTRRE